MESSQKKLLPGFSWQELSQSQRCAHSARLPPGMCATVGVISPSWRFRWTPSPSLFRMRPIMQLKDDKCKRRLDPCTAFAGAGDQSHDALNGISSTANSIIGRSAFKAKGGRCARLPGFKPPGFLLCFRAYLSNIFSKGMKCHMGDEVHQITARATRG